MAFEITFLGQNAWWIELDGHKLIIDPFLDNNPLSPQKAADVDPDFILLSHGHGDHIGDLIPLAKRTGAQIVVNADIADWLYRQGVENVAEQHLGGARDYPFGNLKFTIAHHGSSMPDGAYGGNPAGFIIRAKDGKSVYFACDTALFMDMQLYAGVDVAVLPIGDNYTMGPADALKAVEFIKPKVAIPCHFNTWPPIAQDGEKWVADVTAKTSAKGVLLEPGDSYTV